MVIEDDRVVDGSWNHQIANIPGIILSNKQIRQLAVDLSAADPEFFDKLRKRMRDVELRLGE